YKRHTHSGTLVSLQFGRHSGTGQSAERKRLRQPAERFALQRRPRTGTDGPRRLQHQREGHRMVSFSGGQRSASRVHGSHQPGVQCVFAAASLLARRGIHARLLAELGELLQSGVLLLRGPFGPSNLQKTLSAFPIVLQGSGANAFTPMGGLDNTWIQGRRASRFFINDNLAWSRGAHELRFGTNTRIFRLNDYDFGEGTVPTVTYANLQQFIYGVANTVSETFPSNANEPFNFLNLDVYAQDTWKVTRTLTWTFGLRDTFNSNPLNPHDQVARLRGSFSSIVHDDHPLNTV